MINRLEYNHKYVRITLAAAGPVKSTTTFGCPRTVTKAGTKNYLPLSVILRSVESKWPTPTIRAQGTLDKKVVRGSRKLHSLLPDSNSCQYNARREQGANANLLSQGRKLIVLRTHSLLAIVNIFNFFALVFLQFFDLLS